MAETVAYQCLNCGHQFEEQTLTKQEREEARRVERPVYAVACPKCHRTDVRRGWS